MVILMKMIDSNKYPRKELEDKCLYCNEDCERSFCNKGCKKAYEAEN